MSKRKYTHMKQFEEIIAAMRNAGKCREEIADERGCEMKQVKWCNRERIRNKTGVAPLMLRYSD